MIDQNYMSYMGKRLPRESLTAPINDYKINKGENRGESNEILNNPILILTT